MPASSRMGFLPLAKAEPIRNGSNTSMTTYLGMKSYCADENSSQGRVEKPEGTTKIDGSPLKVERQHFPLKEGFLEVSSAKDNCPKFTTIAITSLIFSNASINQASIITPEILSASSLTRWQSTELKDPEDNGKLLCKDATKSAFKIPLQS
ncbi:hypothetical protein BTVI_83376 [Pitangus sulphuratus]|nr:hypothetical protein BTVI_83376 [Pitangus sulphuratus]